MKESMGAVQLGERTDKKFLTGLIPDGWEERVFEEDTHWSVKCKRHDYDGGKYNEQEAEFDRICDKILEEYGDNLSEIYSITSAGVHFVVYLKKQN